MNEQKIQGKMNTQCSRSFGGFVRAILPGAVVFLVLGVCFFCKEKSMEPAQEARIVAMGDSILAMYSDERSTVRLIGEQAGETIFDASFGGTTLAYADREARLAKGKDVFSFSGLSLGIIAQDFRLQKGTQIREHATVYFHDRVSALANVDFSSTQLLILEYGVNDYQQAIPLEAGEDPYNTYSYEGALRKGISELKKAYPQMDILVLTPTFIWYPDQVMDGESRDFGYGGINHYADMALKVAKEQGVYSLDLYYDLYPHENKEDWMINTDDGMHPNVNGRALIAQKVGAWIKEWSKEKN